MNYTDHENEDFAERHAIMSENRQPIKSILGQYASGFCLLSASYTNEDERGEAIAMAKDYISEFDLPKERVAIKENKEERLISVKLK